jgi:hypothetical protein
MRPWLLLPLGSRTSSPDRRKVREPRTSAVGFGYAVVYVIVFEGLAGGAAAQRLMQICDAYVQLRTGCWIVSSNVPSLELRDFLGDGLDVEVLVGRLNRGWATKGFGRAANWLRRVDDAF